MGSTDQPWVTISPAGTINAARQSIDLSALRYLDNRSTSRVQMRVLLPAFPLSRYLRFGLFGNYIDMGIYAPPGQSAPFATITPTDHRAWIIISSALGLCMSLLFAAIRVFIRSATKNGYGADDHVLAAATVS